MPIMLDNLIASTPIKLYSPKFFDSNLTGQGKRVGTLSQYNNPKHISKMQKTSNEYINCRKRKYSNGYSDVTFIPTYILTSTAWESVKTVDIPSLSLLHKIASQTDCQAITYDVYVDMVVHSIIIEEIRPMGRGPVKKEITVCYQPFIYQTNGSNSTTYYQNYGHLRNTPSENIFRTTFTCNPKQWLEDECSKLIHTGYKVKDQALLDFINNYDLYSGVVSQSELWQSTIDEILTDYFSQISLTAYGSSELNEICTILSHIEDYNIPLDLYRNIYTAIQDNFTSTEATLLCKQNLNLLLSDTLHSLDTTKNQLTSIPDVPSTNTAYSQEQRTAIASNDPLIMVQAGAGTGKSTVVLGRIEHMVNTGIKPEDITVLSFTNAAANHISDRNPNVHSMTIARMIHKIYTTNFSKHELSSIDTIINSVEIYFPNSDFAKLFKNRLISISRNDRDAFTKMNNFIENYYDDVIQILDTLRQTSLELEIIICYQQIDSFIEPTDVQSKYLIIDEVQDTSIFEFVYILKYIDKHKESLFIVGDSSQTLYEFRAANPKALNVLEGSGVFQTFQLQTNFRSNQEILDFANIALADIEANQYANIQLRANSLRPVTLDSFKDKVNFHYERLAKISDLDQTVENIFKHDIKDYIDQCLNRKEQIAFFAYTRHHVYHMENILKEMYPQIDIMNLVPDKMFNVTVFSSFIKKYWGQVNFMPLKNITNIIDQEIMYRLNTLIYSSQKATPQIRKMIDQWKNENNALINAWYVQHTNGVMTLKDFLENVKNNMLHFEIRNNAIKQALLSTRNEESKRKQNMQNADILLSTIHSAKGLEFDHVVVLHRNDNNMDEDKKRMYYVAFTRAKKSEYILTFDTVASPKIAGDYKTIIKLLEKQKRQKKIQP